MHTDPALRDSPDNDFKFAVLMSKAGCIAQVAHRDYPSTPEIRERLAGDHLVSIFGIIALEDNTYFDVWEFSTDTKKNMYRQLNLSAGQMVICRHDCVHAGAAYDRKNIRLHFYMDVAGRKTVSATQDEFYEEEAAVRPDVTARQEAAASSASAPVPPTRVE